MQPRKHIITAKNIAHGNIAITDPRLRTEICTELIMTRMKAIEMLQTGEISKDDVIITRKDRFCLYENIFPNLLSWEEIEAKFPEGMEQLLSSDHTIDLASQIYVLDKELPYSPGSPYGRYHLDAHLIHDISVLEEFEHNYAVDGGKFICVLVRNTPNNPEKNMSINYWGNVVKNLLKQTNYQVPVFVFGISVPTLFASLDEPIEKENPPVYEALDLKSWCTILAHKNCAAVVSTTTGGVYPMFFLSPRKTPLLVIDNNCLIKKHGDSPSFYNSCINFTGVDLHYREYIPSFEELTNTIIDLAKV